MIYGNITDKSEVILANGNYNTIYGILSRDLEIVFKDTESALFLTLHYDKNNEFYFTTKDKKFLGVKLINYNDKNIVIPEIVLVKCLFSVDTSLNDNVARKNIMAGSLFSMKTTIGDINYIVQWKIKNGDYTNLIKILPKIYYKGDKCVKSNNLLTDLKDNNFKGYSSQNLCYNKSDIVYCETGQTCGLCLGKCINENYICFLDKDFSYTCGNPEDEIVNSNSNSNSTNNNAITWVTIISIFVILLLLTFGLSYKFKKYK